MGYPSKHYNNYMEAFEIILKIFPKKQLQNVQAEIQKEMELREEMRKLRNKIECTSLRDREKKKVPEIPENENQITEVKRQTIEKCYGLLTKENKRELFKELTVKPEGEEQTWTGYVSKFNKEKICSVTQERANEMRKKLHYYSCYIYFFLKSEKILNEVQMMCAEDKATKSKMYFVAVNNRKQKNANNAGDREGRNTMEKVRDALSVDENGKIGIKLGDHKEAIKTKSLKGGMEKVKAKLAKKIDTFKFDLDIEFVGDESKADLRHAEEFLCDKAQSLKESAIEYTFYIYGKRRPCITCAARMKTTEIHQFNRKHGRLFLHTTDNMPLNQAKEVIKMLIEESSHITQRAVDAKGNKVDPFTTTYYASDTDDESDTNDARVGDIKH